MSAAAPLRRRVKTRIPGPGSEVMLKRQRMRESAAVSYPRRLPIAIRRAQGSFVEDVDGNVLIDFLTGAGALPLGHGPPEVLRAAAEQMQAVCQGLDFPTPARERFAEAQIALLPPALRARTRIHFCGPTGADAVEAALKLCKLATGGDEVIAFQGAYHGCTHGALAVTGLASMKRDVGNRMPGVHFLPFSSCFRCPLGLARDTCAVNCAELVERALRDPNGGIGRPAAVLVELIQGEGGVNVADPTFVAVVRRVTRDLGIPLIVDEIQTGCGRTGSWFAFERYGITPDVVLASKGLSGLGAPVAIMLYDEALDRWEPGAHIGTFRGNQLAFAAGVAALEVIRRDGVLANVVERGEQARAALESLAAQHPRVGDVRGLGLMLGIELVEPDTGAPDGAFAAALQRRALERGLILEVGGRHDAVVRMLPALNVSEETLLDGLGVLRDALAAAERETPPPGGRRAAG